LYGRNSRALIVIAGGREPSTWQLPPNAQFIHTCGMLDCCDNGGCWKSRVVPLKDGDEKDKSLCVHPVPDGHGQTIPKCLDMISTDDVVRAITLYVENSYTPPVESLPSTSIITHSKQVVRRTSEAMVKLKELQDKAHVMKAPPPGTVTPEVLDYLKKQQAEHSEIMSTEERRAFKAKVDTTLDRPSPKPPIRRSLDAIWADTRRLILEHPSDNDGPWDGLKQMLDQHERAIEMQGKKNGGCWVKKQKKRVNESYMVLIKKEAAK